MSSLSDGTSPTSLGAAAGEETLVTSLAFEAVLAGYFIQGAES